VYAIHPFFKEFFDFSFFRHLFLSIFEKSKKLFEKWMPPYHILILTSGNQKNNFNFVMIKLKYFK